MDKRWKRLTLYAVWPLICAAAVVMFAAASASDDTRYRAETYTDTYLMNAYQGYEPDLDYENFDASESWGDFLEWLTAMKRLKEEYRQSSDVENLRGAYAAAKMAEFTGAISGLIDGKYTSVLLSDPDGKPIELYYNPAPRYTADLNRGNLVYTPVSARVGSAGGNIILDPDDLPLMNLPQCIKYEDEDGGFKVPAASSILVRFENQYGIYTLTEIKFGQKSADSSNNPDFAKLDSLEPVSQTEQTRQAIDISNLRAAYAVARLAWMDQAVNGIRFDSTNSSVMEFYYNPETGELMDTPIAIRCGRVGYPVLMDSTSFLSGIVKYEDENGNPNVPAASPILIRFESMGGITGHGAVYNLTEIKFGLKPGDTVGERAYSNFQISYPLYYSIPTFTNQLEKSRESADLANLREAYAAEIIDAQIIESDSELYDGNIILKNK